MAPPPAATNGAATAVEPSGRQLLTVMVQHVRTFGAAAEVLVTVQGGQRLVISTTTAAVDWLDHREGQPATVHIRPTLSG